MDGIESKVLFSILDFGGESERKDLLGFVGGDKTLDCNTRLGLNSRKTVEVGTIGRLSLSVLLLNSSHSVAMTTASTPAQASYAESQTKMLRSRVWGSPPSSISSRHICCFLT